MSADRVIFVSQIKYIFQIGCASVNFLHQATVGDYEYIYTYTRKRF